jgi:YgiT-type zinc finger domain-containing protein
MPHVMAYDYGRCPCSGIFENRAVEVSMTAGGESIVIPSVPQGVCPLCGSRVYKTEVLARIESVMKRERYDSDSERRL